VPLKLVPAVRDGNNEHRAWALRKLEERLGPLAGRRIAILGLTYKPGTSTLRRSSAVELGQALHARGARVAAYDPAVDALAADLQQSIGLASSPDEAIAGADAVVVATPWPQFRDLAWPRLLSSMARPIVVDANWHLAAALKDHPDVAYVAVGRPWQRGA